MPRFCSPRPRLAPGQSAPVPEARARWAFLHGADVCENPYEPRTEEGRAWMSAWFLERAEDEEAIRALIMERGRLGL